MANKSVSSLLENIRFLSEEHHTSVQKIRALVRNVFPDTAEEVKYGGILFASEGLQFGGVFAYQKHVSVEFSHGAAIVDRLGHLEGSGKGRRHLKLHAPSDIETKQLAHYLPLALAAAKQSA